MEDLLHHMEIENMSDAVEYLEEDLAIICEKTNLEPIFAINKVDQERILDVLFEDLCDRHDDRFPEETEDVYKKIKLALIQSIDFSVLKKEMPSLYYPNGQKFTITKEDIINYLKGNQCSAT
jgi:hypothetical protein